MPSLTSGINLALQAILAHSQAIEIIEHNVANASTPGYRRQAPVLSATVPAPIFGVEHGYGAGQRGTGVAIERIQRFNLEFFDGRYRFVSSEAKSWEAQRDILLQLESTLAETSDDGLLPKLDQFWAGWQALESDPTSTGLRTNLLNEASGLVEAFHRRGEQLAQLRASQDQMVSNQVDTINDMAGEIARLNGEISRVLSVGEQPNDLLDKRDLLLDKLAETTGAVSFLQKNGEVVVAISGHVLVTGHDVVGLTAQPDPANSNLMTITWADGQAFTPPSGTLKGILEVRDQVIPAQQAGLDQLADKLIEQVNLIHRTGYALDDSTDNAFFSGSGALGISLDANLDETKISVAKAVGEPGNSEIAGLLAGLKWSKVMNGNTATLGDFYNGQITELGLTVERASNNAYHHGLVSKALSDQRESVAGVSLDEEAANLAKFQKAYQAAARLMTAYDEMLNTIINGMGLVGR